MNSKNTIRLICLDFPENILNDDIENISNQNHHMIVKWFMNEINNIMKQRDCLNELHDHGHSSATQTTKTWPNYALIYPQQDDSSNFHNLTNNK